MDAYSRIGLKPFLKDSDSPLVDIAPRAVRSGSTGGPRSSAGPCSPDDSPELAFRNCKNMLTQLEDGGAGAEPMQRGQIESQCTYGGQ